ncbi:MAG: adenosylcobalamin-dependent ribonucleoside-diphosphate reductase [Gammaproteobacteria bacterium]|nr:adenosylcobalamin-dependent ribonucleoside-diphosphate reductase [Gammaproteobacteria bacterium]
MNPILQEAISTTIWDIKYRYRREETIIDQTIEDTWRRVARAVTLAEAPSERTHWEKAFYHLLENFRFLPGGRILAGAGTAHRVTLFNCFVMDIPSDSIRGIFDALEEGALTLQQGGGVGYDFSVLRPKGDWVKKTGLTASGPVSFMRIWDTTCSVLQSTGARRGAMMGVMRCDHPDIEAFVTAKSDPQALRHFNVSVMVSDAFMQAVKRDDDWPLIFPLEEEGKTLPSSIVYRQWGQSLMDVPCRIYRVVKARELWKKIITSAYNYAEPGVLFADTINRLNPLYYCERINATNPCGEIPLPAYGACNLGAVNLTQFVVGAFTDQAQLNWSALEETVALGVRFQDNIVDVSHYPLEVQKDAALATRRLGLGVTGLADAMVMLGIVYGSPASCKFAEEMMKRVAYVSWATSIELAREKGSFPLFEKAYLEGDFVRRLDSSLLNAIKHNGLRNSHHNTIAPAGTISLLANNISNGIEPIFKGDYDRHVRAANGDILTFEVKDYALKRWQENGNVGLPPAWIDTDALTPKEHLAIQAAVQPYIDNAISKTINLPETFPFADLENVYTEAYELGLKGCTVFRPNPITGSVLVARKVESPPGDHCNQCED